MQFNSLIIHKNPNAVIDVVIIPILNIKPNIYF